jgi:hypothetical protein
MTRKRLTNVVTPDAGHAHMGQLLKLRTYPPVVNHAVTAPNADTNTASPPGSIEAGEPYVTFSCEWPRLAWRNPL